MLIFLAFLYFPDDDDDHNEIENNDRKQYDTFSATNNLKQYVHLKNWLHKEGTPLYNPKMNNSTKILDITYKT